MSPRPDFPDWISPMLVKELRQGLRSRAFLISFLTLQVAMILLTFAALLLAAQSLDTGAAGALFWIAIGVPVLLIMPASGLNAIASEIKENTLELIFLSRLSARRIVLGKWLAVICQTLLLLSAILPYLVLRYYLGGVNLVRDFAGLGWMLLGSALLTGLTIGLSPHTGRVGRALIPIGLIFGMQFLGILINLPVLSPVSGGGLGLSGNLTLGISLFLLGLLFLVSLMELGAQKIAPAAENHSSSKRLAAIVTAVVCGLNTAFWPSASWIWIAGAVILVPIAIGSVCEPVRLIAGLYRPFARRGLVGRLVALLLFPGWASGALFVFVLLTVLLLIPNGPFAGLHRIAWGSASADTGAMWAALMAINICGFFFLPAALMRMPRVSLLPPAVPFFVFQLICAVLALLGHLANSDPQIEQFVAMIPSAGLFLGGVTSGWEMEELQPTLIGAFLITGVSLLFLFIKALPVWRAMTELKSTPGEPVA